MATLGLQARAVEEYCAEGRARLLTVGEEAARVGRSGLSPRDYLAELAAAPSPDVCPVRYS
jgi:hypothetical protein